RATAESDAPTAVEDDLPSGILDLLSARRTVRQQRSAEEETSQRHRRHPVSDLPRHAKSPSYGRSSGHVGKRDQSVNEMSDGTVTPGVSSHPRRRVGQWAAGRTPP